MFILTYNYIFSSGTYHTDLMSQAGVSHAWLPMICLLSMFDKNQSKNLKENLV